MHVEGAEPCQLLQGDFALVPHAAGHRLSGEIGDPAGKLFDLPRELRFLTAEASELQAGGETIITRLADILVIQAIRTWIARDPAAQTGWLGALRDRQIGRAIGAIHREPTRRWTLTALADAAGMSRSAFAARFTQLVGEPAMRHVARWKMHAAHGWLLEEEASLVELAPARLRLRSRVQSRVQARRGCVTRRRPA
jgi:AraC-like DNA-binding protein